MAGLATGPLRVKNCPILIVLTKKLLPGKKLSLERAPVQARPAAGVVLALSNRRLVDALQLMRLVFTTIRAHRACPTPESPLPDARRLIESRRSGMCGGTFY